MHNNIFALSSSSSVSFLFLHCLLSFFTIELKKIFLAIYLSNKLCQLAQLLPLIKSFLILLTPTNASALSNFSIIFIKTFDTFYFLIFFTFTKNSWILTTWMKLQSAADVLFSIYATQLATYIFKQCDLHFMYCNANIEFYPNLGNI